MKFCLYWTTHKKKARNCPMAHLSYDSHAQATEGRDIAPFVDYYYAQATEGREIATCEDIFDQIVIGTKLADVNCIITKHKKSSIDTLLCTDMWQYIMEFCNLRDKLTITVLSTHLYDSLYIYSFHDCDANLVLRITDDIIKQQVYTKLQYLNLNGNLYVTDINHLKNLKELDAHGSCKLNNNGIKELNIKTLKVSDNPNITDITHMTDIVYLDASGNCGLTDEGIKNINPRFLKVADNPDITNVNDMSNLRYLDASGSCGINDKGLLNVNLKHLIACDNPKITKIDHMSNLFELHASGYSGINDDSLKNLDLDYLNVSNNCTVTNVKHLKYLYFLDISGEECGVDIDGINFSRLEDLIIRSNTKINIKDLPQYVLDNVNVDYNWMNEDFVEEDYDDDDDDNDDNDDDYYYDDYDDYDDYDHKCHCDNEDYGRCCTCFF